jgi:hypothetical protein
MEDSIMYRLNADGTITDSASIPENQCEYGGLVRGNFSAFMARQPVAERQAEGWYEYLIEGDVDQPTVDPITDALIVPRPVPAAPMVEADPLIPYADMISKFSALWASLNIGPVPSDWSTAMGLVSEQPIEIQVKLLTYRVALSPVWDVLLERTNQ